MKAFLGSQLSENLAETPEHYLLCRNVPLCRTATLVPQIYRGSEIGIANSDAEVKVWRSPEEVFSRSFMASLEGKIVVSPHPPGFLGPDNTAAYSKGAVLNLRPADELLPDGERALLGDLMITDGTLISQVRNRSLRDVSVGYNAQYLPNSDGSFNQVNLIGNHVAVVPVGRAGESVRIADAAAPGDDYASILKRYHRRNALEVEQIPSPTIVHAGRLINDQEVKRVRKQTDEKELDFGQVMARLDRVIGLVEGWVEQKTARDSRPRRTLRDQASSIVRAADRTGELIRSGVGPGTFHEALRRSSPAYDAFATQRDAGADYEDSMNAWGAKLRGEKPEDCRPSIVRRRVTDSETEEDWAASVNRLGDRMRGKS